MSSQDWWTKTKKEAVPADLTSTKLLVEKFKTLKLDDAPPQAFLDKDDRDEHPLLKKTNDNLEDYNADLKEFFKTYKYEYQVVSKTRSEDKEKFPVSEARYTLKHEVYLRKYQKNGVTRHYYTYLFYFFDRQTERSYPYIYLFDEKRLESVKVLIGYLNTL
ncbi:MAG: hypothetical protein RIC15_06110 [Vicingaceae bacterium]